MTMNKTISLAAITLVAVVMGMSAFAPAMAVPNENSSADVRLCHLDAESGLWEPISVHGNGAQNGHERHGDFEINSDGSEDLECLSLNMGS